MASPVDSILERSHRVKIRGLSLRFRGAPRTRPATTYSDGSLHARTNSTMNSIEATLVQGGDRPGSHSFVMVSTAANMLAMDMRYSLPIKTVRVTRALLNAHEPAHLDLFQHPSDLGAEEPIL